MECENNKGGTYKWCVLTRKAKAQSWYNRSFRGFNSVIGSGLIIHLSW